MKPPSDLPFRVLASLLILPAIAIVGAVVWPQAAAILAGTAVIATMLGGWTVAREARRRRAGEVTGDGADGEWIAVAAMAVGAVVAALAAALGAPGLYVKDAGELASSALVLGVAHPTGFPAFCLLGRAFGYLPAGDQFLRMNLLSAVSLGAAGAAAWAVARVVAVPRDHGWIGAESGFGAGKQGGPLASGSVPGPRASRTAGWAALAAPAALLASPTTWLHGTTTEVYALSAAGMAATMGCVLVAARRGDARWLVLGAFGVGLGAGGHVTWPVEAGFVAAVATICLVWRRPAAWRALPAAAVALVAGALVVLYLPVAASRHPIQDWGDPSTASAVWDHLTGARIRRSFAGQIGAMTPAVLWANLRIAGGTLAEGTLALWPLAIVGLAWASARDAVAGVALAGVVAGDLAFAARINPMGIRDLQVLVPATMAIGVLAASGVEALAAGARRIGRPGLASLAVALGLGAALAQGAMAPDARDRTIVEAPREMAASFLEGLPPGATVLAASDDVSATVAGLQAVEGTRPDVLALVKQHLSDTEYVTRVLDARGGRPGEEGLREALALRPFERMGEDPAAALVRAVDLASARGPVWVETGEGRVDVAVRHRLEPGFPACAVKAVGADEAIRAARAAAARAAAGAGEGDRWTRAFLGSQVRGLATMAAQRGGDEAARELAALAVRLNPRDPRALHNLGVLVADGGDPEAAVPWLRRAVDEDPSYARAWRTLARVLGEAGRDADAARAAAEAAALGE